MSHHMPKSDNPKVQAYLERIARRDRHVEHYFRRALHYIERFIAILTILSLVGALCIMALFAGLILRGYWIALQAPDRFSTMLAAGLITLIAVQTVLNLCVVTNILPSTGIALPFFSYGGTALAVNLGEMGIVLSVSRYKNYAASQEAMV